MSAMHANVEANVTMGEEVRARPQTSAMFEQGFEGVSSQHGSETCSREGKCRHRVVLPGWAVDTHRVLLPKRDDARRAAHAGEGYAPEMVADASPPFAWAGVPELGEGLIWSAHVERGGQEDDGREWDASGWEKGDRPRRDVERGETNHMACAVGTQGGGLGVRCVG